MVDALPANHMQLDQNAPLLKGIDHCISESARNLEISCPIVLMTSRNAHELAHTHKRTLSPMLLISMLIDAGHLCQKFAF